MVRSRVERLLRGEIDADTINTFVKQEPHKRSKIDSGRYRLISGVSFVDCMIDRIIWGALSRKVLDNVGKTPVLYGWTPIRGQYKKLLSKLAGSDIMALDKEAWDWNVRGWMVRELFVCLTRLCVDDTDWWLKLAWMRWQCVFRNPVFELPDGDVYKQNHWGVMKSGCYLTLLGNSVMQWILHEIAADRLGLELGHSVYIGDDSVQAGIVDPGSFVRCMESLGVKCKQPVITRGECEFVGSHMRPDSITPAYREKHEFLLRHVNPDTYDDTLASYSLLYAHVPAVYKALAGLVTDNGLTRLHSRKYWIRILDEPED